MAIFRLKTATKAAMTKALKASALSYSDGELITATHGYFIKIRGKLLKKTGNLLVDNDGNEYAETDFIDGYHADLVTDNADIIESLSEITITVDNPLFKIAGES